MNGWKKTCLVSPADVAVSSTFFTSSMYGRIRGTREDDNFSSLGMTSSMSSSAPFVQRQWAEQFAVHAHMSERISSSSIKLLATPFFCSCVRFCVTVDFGEWMMSTASARSSSGKRWMIMSTTNLQNRNHHLRERNATYVSSGIYEVHMFGQGLGNR